VDEYESADFEKFLAGAASLRDFHNVELAFLYAVSSLLGASTESVG
jgi:hypothetical protein